MYNIMYTTSPAIVTLNRTLTNTPPPIGWEQSRVTPPFIISLIMLIPINRLFVPYPD